MGKVRGRKTGSKGFSYGTHEKVEDGTREGFTPPVLGVDIPFGGHRDLSTRFRIVQLHAPDKTPQRLRQGAANEEKEGRRRRKEANSRS